MATKKNGAGRPKKAPGQKVKMMSAYLTEQEIQSIKVKYENLTKAVKKVVLPKCTTS